MRNGLDLDLDSCYTSFCDTLIVDIICGETVLSTVCLCLRSYFIIGNKSLLKAGVVKSSRAH